jgi:thiamine-phosphate pyrophosphorylase
LVTDPQRTPDPVAAAHDLPRGMGVIYRSFGNPNAVQIARALRRVCTARGLLLLIGADAALAARAGADGVHLPERLASRAPRLRRQGWIVTAAAHSAKALRARGVDAFLLSPAFESRSPSAGKPLGPLRVARLVRLARAPVYALGGVNARTVRRLKGSGVVGIAAVEGLRP